MQFQNPAAFWGLLALSVPILLHLFNLQKYRKVYFSNVRFLQQLLVQTRKQSTIRHWLVLILRLLAIAALVTAFAKPVIPPPKHIIESNDHTVSIYIDNSFSMELAGDKGRLIEEAKSVAREIVNSHLRSTRFHLITCDFDSQHLLWLNQDEVISMIDQLETGPAIKTLDQVFKRQSEFASSTGTPITTLYYISDFQQVMVDFSGFRPDSMQSVFFIPLKANEPGNISLDTCWFEKPIQFMGQVNDLQMVVSNHGKINLQKVPLRLIVNGIQRSLVSLDIDAGTRKELKIPLAIRDDGIYYCHIETDDYPLAFDNQLYFSFTVLPLINVLSIFDKEPSLYLRAIYEGDSSFTYQQVNYRQLDYSTLSEKQLVILQGISSISSGMISEFVKYVKGGGSLLVIPDKAIDLKSYNQLLDSLGSVNLTAIDTTNTRIDKLDMMHPLFANVFEKDATGRVSLPPDTDLPTIRKHFMMSLKGNSRIEQVIQLRNGNPFLTANNTGEGTVWVLAVPLQRDASDFPIHALFVPVTHRIALLSSPHQPIYHLLGNDAIVLPKRITTTGDKSLSIKSLKSNFAFIPGQQRMMNRTVIFALSQLRESGHYAVVRDEETLLGLSFNYDRRESILHFTGAEELQELAVKSGIANFALIKESSKPIGQVITEMSLGTPIWKYFILLALLCLLAEAITLRWL